MKRISAKCKLGNGISAMPNPAIQEKLISYFPDQVLKTSIRETTALAESPSFGLTVEEHQKGCHGANDYRSLAEDFQVRLKLSGQILTAREQAWHKDCKETKTSSGY